MMIIKEVLRTMDTELERIVFCLNRLPEDLIWKRHKSNMNSIGNLCVHLAGNEYQHFVSGIGGKPLKRERSLEFTKTGHLSKEELINLLNKTRTESKEILNDLNPIDLDRKVTIYYSQEDWNRMKPRNINETEPCYTRTILVHLFQVCEHYGYHVGQIVLLTKLLQLNEDKITGYRH